MQTTIEHMLSSTPNRASVDGETLAACLRACAECEIACRSCADACLGEPEIDPLRRCIRLNLDCAALCAATIDIASRTYAVDAAFLTAELELCARICEMCATECEKHQHHEHCKVCAGACRGCADACRAAIGA